MASLRRVVRFLPFVVIVAMMVYVPHVKVEESFNTQLMHDALFGGGRLVAAKPTDRPQSQPSLSGQPTRPPAPKWIRGGLRSYDHHSFPGVVPRTTVGALAVAAAAQPFVRLADWINTEYPGSLTVFGLQTRLDALVICRLVLGIAFAFSLLYVADGVTQQYRWKVLPKPKKAKAAASSSADAASKSDAESNESAAPQQLPALHDPGCWLLLLECFAMYHLMNSASRPFPNTFAALLVNVAVGRILRGKSSSAVAILAATTVVFRSDVAVFAAPLCLALLFGGYVRFFSAVAAGVTAAATALLASAAVDSIMWGRVLWPEGVVFYYNTVLNKSHEWGVMAWHWYFSNALPRGMLVVLPLAVVALVASKRCGVPPLVRLVSFAAFVFVALYSWLPHKEVRFILMAFPALAAPAACLVATVWRNRVGGIFGRLLVIAVLLACGAYSAFSLYANSKVYAGAKALTVVHDDIASTWAKMPLEDGEPWRLRVYLDAFACMNGITRFEKLLPTKKVIVTYSKDPHVFNRTWFESTKGAIPPGCGDESPASFDYLVVRHEDEAWHLARCGESAVPLKKIADVKMWQPKLLSEWPFIGFRKPKFLSVLKIVLE